MKKKDNPKKLKLCPVALSELNWPIQNSSNLKAMITELSNLLTKCDN